MGNKFHKTYDGHNPKDHPSYLGNTEVTGGDDGGHSGTSLHPEDSLVTHDRSSPYDPNTPYLGGMNNDKGSADVFGAVHGDLCVEKRNGICRRGGG